MSASPGLKRILVVEDEGDLRGLVTRILEDSGYAVLAAEDGWSAIEALQANPPDLILLDLRLPVLDGWTVLEFARRSVPSPAVALMTVCSDADSIVRGLRAGIAGCVFKPFRIRDLVTTCDRILWRRAGYADEHQDRRRERRRPLALDVTALAGAGFAVAPAKLVDLSMSGAQVDLDASLEPGERMRVSFDFFDGEPGWILDSQVRWRGILGGEAVTAHPSSAAGYTYGVAFVDVAPEHERQLRRLLPDID